MREYKEVFLADDRNDNRERGGAVLAGNIISVFAGERRMT